jgi:hypothetical protein
MRSGHHAIAFWLARNLVPAASVDFLYEGKKKSMVAASPDHTIELFENELIRPSVAPTIIILRDPYNNYASYLELVKNPNYGPLSFFPILKYWQEYAREALGETNRLRNRVFISYNDWVNSEEYRKNIVAMIGSRFGIETKFDDSLFQKMTPYGGYSSFDGNTHKEDATKMKVHERWKKFENSIRYRENVDTPEIRELSEKLFNFYPLAKVEPKTNGDWLFFHNLF